MSASPTPEAMVRGSKVAATNGVSAVESWTAAMAATRKLRLARRAISWCRAGTAASANVRAGVPSFRVASPAEEEGRVADGSHRARHGAGPGLRCARRPSPDGRVSSLCRASPASGRPGWRRSCSGGARQRGAPAAWGSGVESTGAPPFWPWVQVLRALADRVDLAALAAGAASRPTSPSWLRTCSALRRRRRPTGGRRGSVSSTRSPGCCGTRAVSGPC